MALLIGLLATDASVDRGSVGELLGATVEDVALDELQVEVGGAFEIGSARLVQLMIGNRVSCTRSTSPAAISDEFDARLRASATASWTPPAAGRRLTCHRIDGR